MQMRASSQQSERGLGYVRPTGPVSTATVAHHQTGDEEHWTVLKGSTVVAYCTTSDQAANLAAELNEAKRTGDRYEQTKVYMPLWRSDAAAWQRARCQGLEISPAR
jgi:hypothetical protein